MSKATEIIVKVRECENKAMNRLTKEQRDELLALTKIYICSCSEAMKNE